MDTLDFGRLPKPLAARVREVAKADFLERADNAPLLRPPRSWKEPCGVRDRARAGGPGALVLFTPTFKLLQDLLEAKRGLKLSRAPRRSICSSS